MPRTRAVHAHEKASRRETILDAAERLIRASPDGIGLMSDVAAAAGVAKGTLYLYFPSKEQLLLALHERHVEVFFGALNARLDLAEPMKLEDMFDLTDRYIVGHPTYMPCASVCFGAMERSMPADEIAAHMLRVADWMTRAARGIARHYALTDEQQAVALLRRSYALMVGLWQLLKPEAQARVAANSKAALVFRAEYAQEVRIGLYALWGGIVQPPPALKKTTVRKKASR
jgi:AcrR family transcriptional regulator